MRRDLLKQDLGNPTKAGSHLHEKESRKSEEIEPVSYSVGTMEIFEEKSAEIVLDHWPGQPSVNNRNGIDGVWHLPLTSGQWRLIGRDWCDVSTAPCVLSKYRVVYDLTTTGSVEKSSFVNWDII